MQNIQQDLMPGFENLTYLGSSDRKILAVRHLNEKNMLSVTYLYVNF